MADNNIEPIEQEIDIPPAPPTGIYDSAFRNKINALLAWFNTHAIQTTGVIEKLNVFINKLNSLLPKINAAAEMGDMSKYLGEWGDVTSANKGESVSIGDTIYTSKIDNNTEQPPTADWIKQGVNLDDYTQIINVARVKTKSGNNTCEVRDNQIMLTSQEGEDDEASIKINKLDSGDAAKINIIDKDGSQIGDAIIFSDTTKRWILNKRVVLFSGESNADTGTITVAEPFSNFNFIVINFSISGTSENWRYCAIIEKENIVANRRTVMQTEEGNSTFRLNDDLTAFDYDLNGSNNIITSVVGYF